MALNRPLSQLRSDGVVVFMELTTNVCSRENQWMARSVFPLREAPS
jgi:hypothetical protein